MIATNNLGSLGSATGDAVQVYWNPLFRFYGYIPWVLIGFLLLLRENRNKQSWPCLAALIVTHILISALTSLMNEVALVNEMSKIFNGVTLGLCAVWLLAPYLARRSHVSNFLILICILLPVSLVSIVFAYDIDDQEWFAPMNAYIVMCSFVAVNTSLAFNLASRLTKNNYSAWRFIARLAVFTFLIWLPEIVIFPTVEEFFTDCATDVLAWSVLVFLVQLPLLLFSMAIPSFRQRLQAWQGRQLYPKTEVIRVGLVSAG